MGFRLIPRDESFYPLFDAAAENAAEAARLLESYLDELPLSEAAREVIAAAERTGDEITRSVRGKLESAIITPFDREDIQYLSGALDDVMDEIRAAADLTYLHNIPAMLPGVDTLIQLLAKATVVNVRLVSRLRSLKDITACVDEIDSIESEADAEYRRVMAELFNGHHDALEILRWKDVVEAVEKAINFVEEASDIIASIAVKHAEVPPHTVEMLLIVIVVAIALIFDFVNGFHDAANSIATVVATRVLKPWQAVLWAAFWNFAVFLVLPLTVANEIAKIVDPNVVTIGLVFAGLCGAIFWNVLTAWLGLPSSSSHALIGGMIGAGVAKGGWSVVNGDLVRKTAVFIVYSPLIGLIIALTLLIVTMWIVHKIQARRKVDKTFRGLQLVSAAAFSLGHGANDAEKTMGIIAALLIGAGHLDPDVLNEAGGMPLWIVLSCHFAIALGTMLGGWRIVRTMGTKLTRLQPMTGVCAESAAAATLFFTSIHGIPVSTTHTITGAIVGVGTAERMSAVRWNVARRVVWAWVLTIPGSAAVAAAVFSVVNLFS